MATYTHMLNNQFVVRMSLAALWLAAKFLFMKLKLKLCSVLPHRICIAFTIIMRKASSACASVAPGTHPVMGLFKMRDSQQKRNRLAQVDESWGCVEKRFLVRSSEIRLRISTVAPHLSPAHPDPTPTNHSAPCPRAAFHPPINGPRSSPTARRSVTQDSPTAPHRTPIPPPPITLPRPRLAPATAQLAHSPPGQTRLLTWLDYTPSRNIPPQVHHPHTHNST